jgi:hypothetical protein
MDQSKNENSSVSASADKDASSSDVPLLPMDLIVNGVWLPIAALLKEKFPGMFFVGIASILARCYLAVDNFIGILEGEGEQSEGDLVLLSSGSGYSSSSSGGGGGGGKRQRLRGHSAVQSFHENWKLDLYLQVFVHFHFHLFSSV